MGQRNEEESGLVFEELVVRRCAGDAGHVPGREHPDDGEAQPATPARLSARHHLAVRAAPAAPGGRMSRNRVVVAGLGDVGVLTAIRLSRHADAVGISVKPALVSARSSVSGGPAGTTAAGAARRARVRLRDIRTARARAPGYLAVGDVAATDPLRSSARNRGDVLVARNVRADFAGRAMHSIQGAGAAVGFAARRSDRRSRSLPALVSRDGRSTGWSYRR